MYLERPVFSWTEGPTKTHQRRDVALDGALLALLTKRRAEQEAYASVIGTSLVVDPFILSPVATGASPLIPDTLTDSYRRTAKQLSIATHLHELRHFAATTAIGAGADVRTVAGRLGHADASVTLRVYAHALEVLASSVPAGYSTRPPCTTRWPPWTP